jgi:glycosyltransferase involved in cell wall biosynthesis
MISLDSALLTQQIGNARARHEAYAEQVGGRISLVICNRRGAAPLSPYQSERLNAQPTESRSFFHYLLDGYRVGVQIHAEQPVDLITSQDPFLTALVGQRLRRRLHVPLIIQDHSSFLSSPYFVREKRRNLGLRLLGRLVLPRADAVRVVNRRERLACIRLGVKAERVCVIPVAVDLSRFKAPASPESIKTWRQKLNLAPDTPTVLWVGRPVAFKNLPLLLNAFERVQTEIPEARLVLAGDMSGTNIPGQIAVRGLTEAVRLPGAVAYEELPALYQAATVYALSSNYEGLPRVLLEAGAAGLPVVSTDNAGAADLIVEGITGKLVPIGGDEAMAHALVDLLRQPGRRREIGQRARQHVLSAFDEQDLVTRWTGMWKQVAKGAPPCMS